MIPALGTIRPVALIKIGFGDIMVIAHLTHIFDKTEDRVVESVIVHQHAPGFITVSKAVLLPEAMQTDQGPVKDARYFVFQLIYQHGIRVVDILPFELHRQNPAEKSVAVIQHPGQFVGRKGELAIGMERKHILIFKSGGYQIPGGDGFKMRTFQSPGSDLGGYVQQLVVFHQVANPYFDL